MARPTLASTLRVYHRFGVNMAAHVFSQDPKSLPPDAGASQYEAHLRPPRHPRQIDWEQIHAKLLEELKRPIRHAPSFISVSAQLDIERRTLRAHDPVLCRRLAAHWRQRRHYEIRTRNELLKRNISAALLQIAAVGEAPTQKRIETALNRPGLFNRRYARRVLDELLA